MENRNSKNNQIRHAKVNNQKIQNQLNNSAIKTEANIKQIKNATPQETQQANKKPLNTKKEDNKKSKIITACIIFGLTFLVAILGTIMGGKMANGRINPPAYPPNWLFPIAWGILYILIALATYIFYQNKHDQNKRKCAMIWYGVHLFFNLFWPLFYSRLDQLIISCFILLSMVITSIVLTFKYFKNNLISGWIFTFYTLWLLYAMYLNLGITLLNI